MKMIGLARLTRDAEVRYTQQGDPVAGFSIAYNYGKKDSGGNQPAQFIKCSLWGKRAESLAPYLLKGKRFLIELDDIHIEEYEGKNGPGVNLVGRVVDVGFADTFDGDGGFDKPVRHHEDRKNPGPPVSTQNAYAAATGRSMAAQAPAPATSGSMADLDDDIPFNCYAPGRAWAAV